MLKEYIYINPYLKNKGEHQEPEYKFTFRNGIEKDTIYLHNTQFRVDSYKDRPLVRASIKGKKGYVIRKISGKNQLLSDQTTFDPLTFKEMNGSNSNKVDSAIIQIQEASLWDRYYRYFKHHPKEDIRLAYNLFMVGVLIGLLSIGLGIWGLICGC